MILPSEKKKAYAVLTDILVWVLIGICVPLCSISNIFPWCKHYSCLVWKEYLKIHLVLCFRSTDHMCFLFFYGNMNSLLFWCSICHPSSCFTHPFTTMKFDLISINLPILPLFEFHHIPFSLGSKTMIWCGVALLSYTYLQTSNLKLPFYNHSQPKV